MVFAIDGGESLKKNSILTWLKKNLTNLERDWKFFGKGICEKPTANNNWGKKKYLGIYLIKEVKISYTERNKTLLKEI
jgi:hypothetical protein